MSKEVVVYSKENCMACAMTKHWFQDMGVSFTEQMLDEESKNRFKDLGLSSMPVVLVDGKVVASGFQPDELEKIDYQGVE